MYWCSLRVRDGSPKFLSLFQGDLLWEGWKLLLNDGNLTLTKEISHRRKWFGLVFHTRGGGIGGGTVGLVPFDENFAGSRPQDPKNIDSFGKHLPKVPKSILDFFSCPHQLIWASAALAHWYIKSAHSRVNAVFFCHVLATNRIHVRDVSTKRGIGCSLLSNMFLISSCM